MFFDLQRFDGVTSSDKWTVLKELDENHYTEANAYTTGEGLFWGFVPAGTTYTEGTPFNVSGRGENITDTVVRSVTPYVFAKSDVELKINGGIHFLNDREDYRAIGNIENQYLHGVEGTTTAITVGMHGNKTVSDLVVEGDYATKTALKITIDGEIYNVYGDGSVGLMPPFGLMKKADKEALATAQNTLNTHEARIGTLEMDMSTAIVGGEMTANGFVLKNKIGADVATIQSVGLDAETAAATYATKAEMRQYVRQVIASSSGYTFVDGSGTTVAEIPVMS